MGEFRFENVRLALGDPNAQVRGGLKGALFAEGFREIMDTGTFANIQDAVERNVVDAVIADADLPGGDVCEMTNLVRHHKVGNNPFLLMFIMTSDPTPGLVRHVVDSGADDLIVKPCSPETLITRIKTLARGRKPFVVTHDYIGPDRRKQARGDAPQAPLIDVPNPLRSKAVANADGSSLQRLIDAAAARVNEQKMERYATQIGYLVERIVPGFAKKRQDEDRELLAHLERLGYVAEDLSYRLRGTPYAHVAELALSLIGVAERLRGSLENADLRDVELLPKIAQAFARAFNPERRTADVAHQISESVRSFTQRQAV